MNKCPDCDNDGIETDLVIEEGIAWCPNCKYTVIRKPEGSHVMSDTYTANGREYNWTGCHADKTGNGDQCQSKQKGMIIEDNGRRFCNQHRKMWEENRLKGLIPPNNPNPRLTQWKAEQAIEDLKGVHKASDVLRSIEENGGRVSQAYINKENSEMTSNNGFTTYTVIGHRPGKLPGGYDTEPRTLKTVTFETITEQLDGKKGLALSGSALGPDQWTLRIGAKRNDPTAAILPFRGFGHRWTQASKDEFVELLQNTDQNALRYLVEHRGLDEMIHDAENNLVTRFMGHEVGFAYVTSGQAVNKFDAVSRLFLRNQVLMDLSDVIIAVINKAEWNAVQKGLNVKGGTVHAVQYALNKGYEVIPVHPDGHPNPNDDRAVAKWYKEYRQS